MKGMMWVAIYIAVLVVLKILDKKMRYAEEKKIKHRTEAAKKYANIANQSEFEMIYEEIMADNEKDLKKQRRKKLLISIGLGISFVCSLIFPIILIVLFDMDPAWGYGFIILPFAFMFLNLMNQKPSTIRSNIVKALIMNIDSYIKYEDMNGKYSEQITLIGELYTNSGFRDKESNRKTVSDYMEYRIDDDTTVKLSDVYLREERRSNKHTYIEENFKGIIAKIENRKLIENNILIEIDQISSNKYFASKKEESDEPFEKIFDLRVGNLKDVSVSMDETVKRELLNLYYEYGIMFEVSMKETNIYIRFYTGDLFEIDDKNMKQIKKDLCRDYYMFKNILVMINKINTILNQDDIISIRQNY